MGDQNNDGHIDEDEYMKLYYQAVAGKPYELKNNLEDSKGIGFALAFGATSIVNSVAAFLRGIDGKLTMEQSEVFQTLTQIDANNGIDANGDGQLSRDEFENAAINYILTNPELFQ